MPGGDAITIRDHVQGAVSLKTDDLDDLILLRSDGAPTYMLAVVVDDHDMGVTHVIRGDDHFMNTFRQAPIFEGMGWAVPEYAHIPLIHGPDGKKLSKRHGALGVDAYRDMGFLPEALKNYLARLGWSHGDDELFSEAEAIEWFDLAGLNKAAARLDFEKLRAVNAHYMTLADEDRLFELFRARPEAAAFDASGLARIRAAMSVLKLRAPTLADVAPAARFLGALRPIMLEGKVASLLTEEARQHLSALSERFAKTTDWSEPTLKQEIARYCEDVRVSLGKVGPVLRAVLTGGAPAPDIAAVLALLGREESLARIADQSR
jgi:glutamyl-tRNA synthetase